MEKGKRSVIKGAGRMTRRSFLAGALAAAGIGAAAYVAAAHDTDNIIIEERKLHFSNLHSDLNGLRIGFMTDIHVGDFLPLHEASEIFAKIKNANLDILLLGGDYIWERPTRLALLRGQRARDWYGHLKEVREYFAGVAALASDIKTTYGCYGVLGNHDRWASPLHCVEAFRAAGITQLIDQEVTFKRGAAEFSIYGTDDYWTGDPKPLPDKSGQYLFRILLNHNPDFLGPYINQDNKFDLALCGHTHAGQIRLPLLPPVVSNIKDMRFFEGLIEFEHQKCYTSRGIGTVELPVRINCPGEITVLSLVQGV